MRKTYAVIYMAGGLFDSLYVFEKLGHAKGKYDDLKDDFDNNPDDDDLFLIEMVEDAPWGWSDRKVLRNAHAEWEEENKE